MTTRSRSRSRTACGCGRSARWFPASRPAANPSRTKAERAAAAGPIMLHFSRWRVTAILATALIVCLFAIPNFFPEKTVRSWPQWAQRHIVLGLDLQGGSHILLQVDSEAVRKEK